MPDPWPAWRPIETAPRDGTEILLYEGGDDPRCVVGYWDADTFNGDDARPTWRTNDGEILDFLHEPITHWLPLPPPPEGA